MGRYYYLIVRKLFWFAGVIRKMRKMATDEGKTEKSTYDYLRDVVEVMKKASHVRTEVYGLENLPKEGGYVMYPNHQGKYDAFSIVNVHEKPCTVVMDKAKSYGLFINQVIDLVSGKRLDKEDVRQSLGIILEVTKEVEQGRRYIIFPEGEYDKDKKNTLRDFKAGCFKASLKSKTPVVPVVLIDSYKAWNSNCFGWVTTQVYFLEPIPYEEYKDLKTNQIAALVRERIHEKINEVS